MVSLQPSIQCTFINSQVLVPWYVVLTAEWVNLSKLSSEVDLTVVVVGHQSETNRHSTHGNHVEEDRCGLESEVVPHLLPSSVESLELWIWFQSAGHLGVVVVVIALLAVLLASEKITLDKITCVECT